MAKELLSSLIGQCIAAKQGNKEFALVYYGDDGDDSWKAIIGNRCQYVNVAETSGEFSADGGTMQAAVANLLHSLKEENNGGS
jgi:hypothetical protein